MFGIKLSDIKNLILTNYALLIIEGIFLLLLTRSKVLPVGATIFGLTSILVANLILHLLVKIKAKSTLQELGLILCSLAVYATIAICIYCFTPNIKPSTLLIFTPALILSASLSLSLGIICLIISAILICVLYFTGIHNSPELFSQSLKFQFIFNSFYLLILGSLANLFMGILRKKEREIAKIAEENKKLYQMSKTTSDEIVTNMKEALVVLDSNLKIIRHNAAFTTICKTKEFINKSIKEIDLPFELDIQNISSNILSNDIRSAVSFTKEDRSKNRYEISVNRIDLKENNYGFLIIINTKQSPWGIVFDSETKKPVGLALVRLMNMTTKRITETKVTDDNGNFGFMVPEGKFALIVTKDGYSYPSKSDLGYHGEEFSSAGNLIKLEIPVDKIRS